MSSIHDPRYRNIISMLINIRESKKMTQVQLASCLRKPQSYIAKVENFERRLDIIEMYDWLKALDYNINDFFKFVC